MIRETPLTVTEAIQDMTLADQSNTHPFYMGNELPPGVTVAEYNRTVRRYSKKHDITLDEAFAAIYGGRESEK